MICDSGEALVGTCHCGAARWRFTAAPESATACNCTTCRRYGALWIYGHEGEDVFVDGPTGSYRNPRLTKPHLEFVFCPTCAGVLAWRGLHLESDGRRRMAVNVRLCEPARVGHLPIDAFDGLDTFEDFPPDGRRVANLWS